MDEKVPEGYVSTDVTRGDEAMPAMSIMLFTFGCLVGALLLMHLL